MSDGEVKGSFYRTEIIAQLFGVTVRRVQQLTQEGIISTTEEPYAAAHYDYGSYGNEDDSFFVHIYIRYYNSIFSP